MSDKKNFKAYDSYDIYEDEIDLYELWLRIKKRWIVIVSTIFIFMTVAVGYIFIAKPIYKGTFTVKLPVYVSSFLSKGKEEKVYVYVNFLSPEEVKMELEKLNNLIKVKKYNKVSLKLNLDLDETKKLVSIEAYIPRKSKDTIKIEVETTDPSIIKPISKKIVAYLNNNRYLKYHIETKKSQLKKEIRTIEKAILSLQNLKSKIIDKFLKKREPIYFNPAEIDQVIQNLFVKLMDLKTRLEMLKGFVISVEPEVPSEPAKPKKLLILSISFISSLFFGIFLALFLEWLEEAKKKHNTNVK